MTTEDKTQEEQALSPPKGMCEYFGYTDPHNFSSHCYRGTSVRLCQFCHEIDWDDQEADRKAQAKRLLDAVEERGPKDNYPVVDYNPEFTAGSNSANAEWRSILKELRA